MTIAALGGLRMRFDVLAEIDKYRKHPRFQVERHFDIFLIPYLPNIINYFYNSNYEFAVPEFPLRKALVNDRFKSRYESISVDYAIFDRTKKKIACIELKTDNESHSVIQDQNMKRLSMSVTAAQLLEFIEERTKYQLKNVTTYKFGELKRFLESTGAWKCRTGKIEYFKVGPTNSRISDLNYLSFSKIISEYEDKSDDWKDIRRYLEKWDNNINS